MPQDVLDRLPIAALIAIQRGHIQGLNRDGSSKEKLPSTDYLEMLTCGS